MIKSVMVDGAEALKLMVDGKIAWERSGLPAGYQRCKYLGNTHISQIIDTGFRYKPTSTIKLTVEITSNSDNRFVGTGYDSGIIIASKNNFFPLRVSTWIDNSKQFYEVNKKVDLEVKTINYNTYLYVNGEIDKIVSHPTFEQSTYNLGLFGVSETSRRSFYTQTKFYDYEFYDDGVLVQKFVPAIDMYGTPCMYDTISKQPFYNQGTGEFQYELA